MRLKIDAKTDVGLQRMRNEDNYLVMKELGLVVVADGMGGHVDGNIASQIAVDTLKESYTHEFPKLLKQEHAQTSLKEQEQFLIKAIQEANRVIYNKNKNFFSLDGMGTTVVALQLTHDYALTACVGDSRIYRLREGEIKQLTQDHSLVGELARYNIIGKQDLIFIQNKNIITRALGMTECVQVDTTLEQVQVGDMYLLCSDGLTDLVEDERIKEIAMEFRDDHNAVVVQLIEEANMCGGLDNITVALIAVLPDDDEEPSPEPEPEYPDDDEEPSPEPEYPNDQETKEES